MKCQMEECSAAKLRTLRTTYMGRQGYLIRGDQTLTADHIIRVKACPECKGRVETIELLWKDYEKKVWDLQESIYEERGRAREAEDKHAEMIVAFDTLLRASPYIARKLDDLKPPTAKPRTGKKQI